MGSGSTVTNPITGLSVGSNVVPSPPPLFSSILSVGIGDGAAVGLGVGLGVVVTPLVGGGVAGGGPKGCIPPKSFRVGLGVGLVLSSDCCSVPFCGEGVVAGNDSDCGTICAARIVLLVVVVRAGFVLAASSSS